MSSMLASSAQQEPVNAPGSNLACKAANQGGHVGSKSHGKVLSRQSGPVLVAQFAFLCYQTVFWVSASLGGTESLLRTSSRLVAPQNLGQQHCAEDLL